MAIPCVQPIVADGGHSVPENIIIRRYHRRWKNFQTHYKHMVDDWAVFDNSGDIPMRLEEKA